MKTGLVSEPAIEARPILPVTTPIVEIDGPNANVNIQFERDRYERKTGEEKTVD